MVDLNDLIPGDSSFELVAALDINERGEILGVGVPDRCFPDFCGHTFLLIPCAPSEVQGCDGSGKDTKTAVQSSPSQALDCSTISHQQRLTAKQRVAAWLEQTAQGYHVHRRKTQED
jgi:hypothetical protein